MIIKCKMCGGNIELSNDKTFGTCEYCGSTMTLPKVDDEQRAAAFNRGNHFRRVGEFDKALKIYERIVWEDETDAEAHWCCALCRFGIEYVEDPTSYEWLPTCHRVSFDSFLEDVDYKAAIEYSDGITRRQYMKEAAKIAEVQRGILVTSQGEEPFDVFICYKETDKNGIRTRDSIMAQDIYYQLTEQGYRVFFSRITLEDKTGTQYEPYIFAALNSAKVMIVVGTNSDYLNAVWVKNEWSRFLTLMKKDRTKVLLPCYKDMDPYNLPEQLSILQSYDMGRIGFIQDLLRGIRKIVNVSMQPSVEMANTVVESNSDNHDSAVIMGFLDYEMGKIESALDIFRQILLKDSSCAEAYLGMLLVCEDNEWDTYAQKFKQYAPKKMSTLEEKLFTEKTQEELLREYTLIKDSARVLEALEKFCGEISDNLFIDTIESFPQKEIVQKFIDMGFDINMVIDVDYDDGTGKEPLLSYLLEDDSFETIKVLLECGANPNSERCFINKYGDSYFSVLSDGIWKVKNKNIVKLLLEHGADVNYIDKVWFNNGNYEEKYLLNEAVLESDEDMVKLLLEYGADSNAERLLRDKCGYSYYSALWDCAWKNNAIITKLLLEYGADVNYFSKITGEDGTYGQKYVLNEAVINGNIDITRLLLEYGANSNSERMYRNKYGDSYFSALDDSILKKNIAIVRLLLENGANINYVDKVWFDDGTYGERSMLNRAVLANDVQIVSVLLANDADPNGKRRYSGSKGNEYYSALSDSIWNVKNINIMKILLNGGTDAKLVDVKEGNAQFCMLYNAIVYAKSVDMVKLLLDHGASFDDPVYYEGKHIPLKNYPFKNLSEQMTTVIKNAGWKGKKLFGIF